MGIKFLILQMIPWCFPMTGSTAACHHAAPFGPASATVGGGGDGKASKHMVKLIMADGKVEVYSRPVSAAELMIGHPMHLVCRSDAFTIGQRIPALAEGEQLQPGHAYFLLPARFFQSVLSFVTLASSIALLQQLPFDVHKTPSGSLQIKVSDELIGVQTEEGETQRSGDRRGGGRVCTTAELEKDYRQLVARSRARQWKPKLETIRESEKTGRGRGRLRLVAVGGAAAAFGDIGRHAKKDDQKRQQQQQKQQEQRRRLQQKQQPKLEQEKEEEHKVSQRLGSPHPHHHRSKGKKVVACDL